MSSESLHHENKKHLLLSEVGSLFEFFSYDRAEMTDRFLRIVKKFVEHDAFALVTQEPGFSLSLTSQGVESPDPSQLAEMDLESFRPHKTNGAEAPFVVNRIDESSETPLFPKNGPLRSYLPIPLITNSKLVGLLFLASLKENAFKEEEIDLYFTIGSHLAVILENIRLYEQSQERLDVLASLYQSETSISAAIELDELMDRINAEACRLLNCTASTVFLKREDRLLIFGHRKASTIKNRRGQIGLKELSPRAVEQLFKHKIPYEWEADGNKAPESAFFSNRSTQSILVLPLVAKKQTAAVLALESNRRAAFAGAHRSLVNVLVPHAAAALQNAILYGELQTKVQELEKSSILIQDYAETLKRTNESLERRVYELQTLYDVGTAISASVDLDRILNFIMTKALAVMNCDKGSLMLLDEKRKVLHFKVTRGVNPESARVEFGMGEGISGWVAKFGTPRIVDDVQRDPRFVHIRKGPVRDDTLLCVPLKVEDQVIGVINVDRPKEYGVFTPDEQALLMALSSQAAATIQKAQIFEEVQELFDNTLEAFANAIDTKDANTHGHSKRVREIAVAIATTLNLPPDEIQTIGWAALLHDIGKIFIPNEILNKPAKLTEEEFEVMRAHPVYGAQILRPIRKMKEVAELVYFHHECHDGSGYPEGLKGDAIPLGSAIIAVADAFDTIVSDRPYRKAPGIGYALQEFRKYAGIQFHPLVVGAFLSIVESIHPEEVPSQWELQQEVAKIASIPFKK